MRRVIVESPFAGKTLEETSANIDYARRAVRDCLLRGESPIASHLLLTQPGILRDDVPEERDHGIRAGLAWASAASAAVVYTDRGISAGMELGIQHHKDLGLPIEHRQIGASICDGCGDQDEGCKGCHNWTGQKGT